LFIYVVINISRKCQNRKMNKRREKEIKDE